ncbi:hypothetical protein M0G43_14050 [Subsaxibacter sp. CAU 1640]|uniref:hypothetical protein n=1 Tax=Subsaxibacter sp. CAU 1640 TaxID=2933271 RepID=UPI002004F046|nr:hypothetical protein [Subsaxibacter sp. CAU 1640]MCK7591707.1 hypothetical protein [Subsaxibacter sp. CAU 1640]
MNAKAFWEWFIANESYLRHAIDHSKDDPPPRIFSDVFLEMENYHSGIGYVLSRHPRNRDIFRFTATTFGERSLLMPIKNLFSKAPQLPQWSFKALFGPEDSEDINYDIYETPYTFDQFTFDPKEIQVAAIQLNPENNKTHLQFLLPFRYKTYDLEELYIEFEYFLKELIGEMQVYNRIDFCTISFHNDFPYVPLECIELILEASEDGSMYSDKDNIKPQ